MGVELLADICFLSCEFKPGGRVLSSSMQCNPVRKIYAASCKARKFFEENLCQKIKEWLIS